MTRDELFRQIKENLRAAFGERFRGLVLYGSEARGEAQADSDIDLMVLLQGPVQYGKDVRKIIDVLYPLQLELVGTPENPRDRLLHAIPVDIEVYEAQEYFLYQNAHEEGLRL